MTWDPLGSGPTRDRELDGLFAALEALPFEQGLVLTLDRDERVVRNGRTAVLMPVWRFLLEGAPDLLG